MKSYSQAGQDIFVQKMFPGKMNGTFIDIGCGDFQWSNTLVLEELGWRGFLVDIGDGAEEAAKKRPSKFFKHDAATMPWGSILSTRDFDYLSVDVDHASFKALVRVLAHADFNIITAEHDAYRFTDDLRSPMRTLLGSNGYTLVHGNVCGTPDVPFEDWWVRSSRYKNEPKTDGQHWEKIIASL